MFKIRKIISSARLIKDAIQTLVIITVIYLFIGVFLYGFDMPANDFTWPAYEAFSALYPLILQIPVIGSILILFCEDGAPFVGYTTFLILFPVLAFSIIDAVYRSPWVARIKRAAAEAIIPVSERFQDGEEMMRKGDYIGAINEFSAVLKKKPGYPEAYYSLGYCYMAMNNFVEAERNFQEALKAQPGHVGARINAGLCYLRLGRPENAEKELIEAINQQPGNAVAHFYLGEAYMMERRHDDATVQYSKAKELEPNMGGLYTAMGDNYLKAGKVDEAMEALRSAVMRAPGDDRAHYLLGLALSKKGRYEEAIGEYNAAISINPKEKTYADMLDVAKATIKGPVGGGQPYQGVVHEKEIIKEIVKVPCKYCGTLVENTSERCPNCGAPL
jgi:tetratricopeptide (TPR) repeat protein